MIQRNSRESFREGRQPNRPVGERWDLRSPSSGPSVQVLYLPDSPGSGCRFPEWGYSARVIHAVGCAKDDLAIAIAVYVYDVQAIACDRAQQDG